MSPRILSLYLLTHSYREKMVAMTTGGRKQKKLGICTCINFIAVIRNSSELNSVISKN